MMRDSIETRIRMFVNIYGCLTFAKNMSKNIGKNLSGKYNQKLLDHTNKYPAGVVQTASKR